MIIVMEGGEVKAIGTHEELLKTSEIYGGIYTSQQRELQEKFREEKLLCVKDYLPD